jgi:hypothetical protein
MSDSDKITDIALKIRASVGEIFEAHGDLTTQEMADSLALAMSICISYKSMQMFLENLAACADAKEHVRAIEDGEVPAPH